jgi:hypothetical protein
MKINKKAPIDIITLVENECYKDIKIPNETYSLSDAELIFIKTSVYTKKSSYQQICAKGDSTKLFTFGYSQGEAFFVLESTQSSIHVYLIYKIILPKYFFLNNYQSNQQFNYVIGNFGTLEINKKIKGGLSIMKIPSHIILKDIENYSTLKQLKQSSTEYKKLDNKQKQKIIENIKDSAGTIFQNLENKEISIFLIQHILLGNIIKGKVTGIHHIYPVLMGFAYVESINKYPNKSGVWEGSVGYIDKRANKNIKSRKRKDNISTFFPNHWDTIVLIEECNYAIIHKKEPIIDEIKNQIKWSSNTKSGIKVGIWTDINGKPASIYPIYEE